MKAYETPNCRFIIIEATDVVCASNETPKIDLTDGL